MSPKKYRFKIPQEYHDLGPALNARLSVPDRLRKELLENQRPIPGDVEVVLLFDTGAPQTRVPTELITKLRLIPTFVVYGQGLEYYVKLELGDDTHTDPLSFEMVVLSAGPIQPMRFGRNERIVCRVGRDYLDEVTFTYDGRNRVVILEAN